MIFILKLTFALYLFPLQEVSRNEGPILLRGLFPVLSHHVRHSGVGIQQLCPLELETIIKQSKSTVNYLYQLSIAVNGLKQN